MGVLENWLDAFMTGWQTAGTVAAMCLGGVAGAFVGIVALALLVAVVGALGSWAFDTITNAMAKRWEKTGRRPNTRWADAIARGRRNEE